MLSRYVIKAIVTVVVLAIAGMISFAYRERLRRRAEALDKAGCLSCGSNKLETVGAELHCRACGYVGRADGGGTLTVTEMASLKERDTDALFKE
jgi:hypothetical protein